MPMRNTSRLLLEVTLNGESQSYNRRLAINRDDARSLFNNWDGVTKTGYLSIDPGYRQALALVKLKNPIGQQEFTIEFVTDVIYSLSLSRSSGTVVAFSPDGKYVATRTATQKTSLVRVSDGKKIWGTSSFLFALLSWSNVWPRLQPRWEVSRRRNVTQIGIPGGK